jgi:hypothetical protein
MAVATDRGRTGTGKRRPRRIECDGGGVVTWDGWRWEEEEIQREGMTETGDYDRLALLG